MRRAEVMEVKDSQDVSSAPFAFAQLHASAYFEEFLKRTNVQHKIHIYYYKNILFNIISIINPPQTHSRKSKTASRRKN